MSRNDLICSKSNVECDVKLILDLPLVPVPAKHCAHLPSLLALLMANNSDQISSGHNLRVKV